MLFQHGKMWIYGTINALNEKRFVTDPILACNKLLMINGGQLANYFISYRGLLR